MALAPRPVPLWKEAVLQALNGKLDRKALLAQALAISSAQRKDDKLQISNAVSTYLTKKAQEDLKQLSMIYKQIQGALKQRLSDKVFTIMQLHRQRLIALSEIKPLLATALKPATDAKQQAVKSTLDTLLQLNDAITSKALLQVCCQACY